MNLNNFTIYTRVTDGPYSINASLCHDL